MVYEMAKMKNPGRWSKSTRNWEPVSQVNLNYKPKKDEQQNSIG
jgi:hypothetical protein